MQHFSRPVPVRKMHRNNLNAKRLEQRRELLDSGCVCPESPAHDKSVGIEPHHIAGLGRRLAVNFPENWNAPVSERFCDGRSFAPPGRFAGLQDDGAGVRDQDWIANVQGVQADAFGGGQVTHFGPGVFKKRNEPPMLVTGE